MGVGLTGSGGKKQINRGGTAPTEGPQGVGVAYNEVKHNILMAGSGFMTGNVGTQGANQSEGKGLGTFFMKKMGGAPVIQPPGTQNGSKKNKKEKIKKKYHPLQNKQVNSSGTTHQSKLQLELSAIEE